MVKFHTPKALTAREERRQKLMEKRFNTVKNFQGYLEMAPRPTYVKGTRRTTLEPYPHSSTRQQARYARQARDHATA